MLEENHGGGGLVIGARFTGGAVGTVGADYSRRRGVGNGELFLQTMLARHGLGVAPQENVGSAAGHVGGNGHGSFAPRLGDDLGFAFMLFGVEHLMRDAGFFQDLCDALGFFNGYAAHQDRLAALEVMAGSVLGHFAFRHYSVGVVLDNFLLLVFKQCVSTRAVLW